MNLFKNIGNAVKKAAKDTTKAVTKAAVDTGHAAGAVATNKFVQAGLGVALAATGVGLPAAAAIGAGVKGGGNLLKKGGNLKSAVTGAGQGAALGAGAAIVGSGVRAIKDNTGLGGFRNTLLKGKEGEAESIVKRDKKAQGQAHYAPPANKVAARIPPTHPLPVAERPPIAARNAPVTEAVSREQPVVTSPPPSTGLPAMVTPIAPPKKERKNTPSSAMGAIGQLKDQIETIRQSANSAMAVPSSPAADTAAASSDAAGSKNNTIMLAAAAGVVLLVVMMNRKG
jgi:hypothetical protein